VRRDLKQELLERVHAQVREGHPPAAAEAFHRLRAAGRSQEETLQLLAAALLVETHAMARDSRPFDADGYSRALDALPRILKR
jgi:hypothetical protein